MPRQARKPYKDDEDDMATEGHNSNEALEKSVLERYGRIMNQIKDLRSDAKEILQEGKEGGVLKQAVRAAYKELSMSEEARQAKKEVDDFAARLVALGGDMPLFHVSAMGAND